MSAKHTPGPWVWDPGYCYENLRAPEHVDILEVVGYDSGICAANPADAALIAAAPDLLETLKSIEGGHFDGIADLALAHDWQAVVNLFQSAARAAIAKATGAT
jgi:hypothetical protein